MYSDIKFLKTMKRSVIYSLRLAAPILLFTFGLTGCSSDSDPDQGDDIYGEWFQNISSSDMKILYTVNFKTDGKTEKWQSIIGNAYNIYKYYSGTYTYSNSVLTDKYVNPFDGNNQTDIYDVVSLGKYDMTTYNKDYAATEVLHRIIKTYQMQVGDTLGLSVKNTDFGASSYSSTEPKVAIVNHGIVTALKRGTTYVCATSNKGTAAYRVIVTDPENYIDDFTFYLGCTPQSILQEYGKANVSGALTNGYNALAYYMVDEMIESVSFMYPSNKSIIDYVIVDLREYTNTSLITEHFNKKYTFTSERGSDRYYKTTKDGHEVQILWEPSEREITYRLNDKSSWGKLY